MQNKIINFKRSSTFYLNGDKDDKYVGVTIYKKHILYNIFWYFRSEIPSSMEDFVFEFCFSIEFDNRFCRGHVRYSSYHYRLNWSE